MTRVVIFGGRDFGTGKPEEWLFMYRQLSTLHEKHYFTTIIEGGAPGADAGARAFGLKLGIPVETYAADWKKHGKAAGPIRNTQMIEEGCPERGIAFPGGRGTADMLKKLQAAGIPVTIVSPVDNPCGDRG